MMRTSTAARRSAAHMTSRTLTPAVAPALQRRRAPETLGARVKQLRLARGMTQSELAGSRCTKEYVSQIERGRARPTAETLAYVAGRLGVDATYLVTGQTWNEYHAAEAAIACAEAAIESQGYPEAIRCLEGIAYSPEAPELELRSRL